MGISTSTQATKRGGGGGGVRGLNWNSTVKLIHIDGRLQEFKQPILAEHILFQNPKCFICNSETMYIDSIVPQVPATEELQPGQIYFLMPISHSQTPLSISELCSLAIKASKSLSIHQVMEPSSSVKGPTFRSGENVRLPAGSQRLCKIPAGLNVTRLGSRKDRSNQGVEHCQMGKS